MRLSSQTVDMESLARGRRTAAVRWLSRRHLRRALVGRSIDLDAPERGRFTRHDVDAVAERAFGGFDDLVGYAELDEMERRGNRLNVRLAVLTIALYRALLDAGVPRGHACDLVADAGWGLYDISARTLAAAARFRSRDQQQQINTVIRWLLRFPFSAPGRPGYEVEVQATSDAIYTNWTWCPPQAFVRRLVAEDEDRGDLKPSNGAGVAMTGRSTIDSPAEAATTLVHTRCPTATPTATCDGLRASRTQRLAQQRPNRSLSARQRHGNRIANQTLPEAEEP